MSSQSGRSKGRRHQPSIVDQEELPSRSDGPRVQRAAVLDQTVELLKARLRPDGPRPLSEKEKEGIRREGLFQAPDNGEYPEPSGENFVD